MGNLEITSNTPIYDELVAEQDPFADIPTKPLEKDIDVDKAVEEIIKKSKCVICGQIIAEHTDGQECTQMVLEPETQVLDLQTISALDMDDDSDVTAIYPLTMDDQELPGMWESSDFLGGKPDVVRTKDIEDR